MPNTYKSCSKCEQKKPLSDFYPGTRKCKICTAAQVRANYAKRREQYRAYDKERTQRPDRKKKKLEYQLRSRERHPLRKRARDLVQIHIKSGRLVRPCKCSACLKKCTPEAHHEDYAKPLEVVWLCFKCHRARHQQEAQDFLNK